MNIAMRVGFEEVVGVNAGAAAKFHDVVAFEHGQVVEHHFRDLVDLVKMVRILAIVGFVEMVGDGLVVVEIVLACGHEVASL